MPRMAKVPMPGVELPPAIDRPGTRRTMSTACLTPCWSRLFWVTAATDRDTRLTVSDWRVAVTTTSSRALEPDARAAGAWAKAGPAAVRAPKAAPASSTAVNFPVVIIPTSILFCFCLIGLMRLILLTYSNLSVGWRSGHSPPVARREPVRPSRRGRDGEKDKNAGARAGCGHYFRSGISATVLALGML